MLIKRDNPTTEPCDICQRKKHLTVAHVSQGATGRWCEVLWICETCAGPDADALIPAEQARQQIAESGKGYADF